MRAANFTRDVRESSRVQGLKSKGLWWFIPSPLTDVTSRIYMCICVYMWVVVSGDGDEGIEASRVTRG